MRHTRRLCNERCVSGYRYSSSLKSDDYTSMRHTRELSNNRCVSGIRYSFSLKRDKYTSIETSTSSM